MCDHIIVLITLLNFNFQHSRFFVLVITTSTTITILDFLKKNNDDRAYVHYSYQTVYVELTNHTINFLLAFRMRLYAASNDCVCSLCLISLNSSDTENMLCVFRL